MWDQILFILIQLQYQSYPALKILQNDAVPILLYDSENCKPTEEQ